VRPVKAVPYSDPNHYQRAAKRIAEEEQNAIWANQFDNVLNRQAHVETTGPEIWRDTGGRLDAFVCATGTGGTFAGVSSYLKAQRKEIKTVVADPHGSAIHSWVKTGKLVMEGSSITEGIGIGRVTANLEGAPIDDALRIADQAAVAMVYRLLREEGLYVGGSSGINVAAAVELAKQLGPGHTIVTVLCDRGTLYQQRLFDAKWLASKNLTPA
jgi:cysteine synthase